MFLTLVVLGVVFTLSGGAVALYFARRAWHRRKYPKDYAYLVYRNCRGHDLYASMSKRLPWLTPGKFEPLMAEFTSVDMSIRALAKRSTGNHLSLKYLRAALAQLHPFLKHEGLHRAARAARRRASRSSRGATGSSGRARQ